MDSLRPRSRVDHKDMSPLGHNERKKQRTMQFVNAFSCKHSDSRQKIIWTFKNIFCIIL